MSNETVEILAALSIAYRAGMEAKKLRIPLKQTAIRNLRPGSPQYDDFLAGYDSWKNEDQAPATTAPGEPQ